MGGTGGGIAYNKEEFDEICLRGMELSPTTRGTSRAGSVGMERI